MTRERQRRRALRTGLVAALLILLLTALYGAVSRQASRIIHRQLLREAEHELGLDIVVGESRMNLLRGRMVLHDLQILNPYGFEQPTLARVETTRLQVRRLPLLRGAVEIADLTLTNAIVTILRNEKGQFNLGPARRPTGNTEVAPTNHAEPVPQALSVATLLSYLDDAVPDDQPFAISFVLAVDGRYADAETATEPAWYEFGIRGHLEGDPRAFVTKLQARIAPEGTSDQDSFDLNGTINAIRPADLGVTRRTWELQFDAADLAVSIGCRDGFFTEPSTLRLTLAHPRLSGQLARSARNMPLPPELVIEAPLRGSLDAPQLDVRAALIRTVLANLSGSLGTLLESTTIDGKKLDGDLEEAARKIGKLLENW